METPDNIEFDYIQKQQGKGFEDNETCTTTLFQIINMAQSYGVL